MRGLGGTLIVLGLGSLILPVMDMQFAVLQPLEDVQPMAGITVAVIGALLIFLAERQERARRAAATAEAVTERRLQAAATPAAPPRAEPSGSLDRTYGGMSTPVPPGPTAEPGMGAGVSAGSPRPTSPGPGTGSPGPMTGGQGYGAPRPPLPGPTGSSSSPASPARPATPPAPATPGARPSEPAWPSTDRPPARPSTGQRVDPPWPEQDRRPGTGPGTGGTGTPRG